MARGLVIVRTLPAGATSVDLPSLIGPEARAVLTSGGCPRFTPEVHGVLPALVSRA